MPDGQETITETAARARKKSDAAFSHKTVGSAVTSCPKALKDVKIPKGCEYLNKPYTVEAAKSNFDAIRGTATISKGTPGKYKFPGDKTSSDSIAYVIDVKGKKIDAIVAKTPPKGKHVPSVQQIADALAATPKGQLGSVDKVVVSPNQNPSDAYWAKHYNIPNFSSVATGGNGGATFYPKSSAWTQEFVDSTMIHESGHTYSQDLWKDPKTKTAWEAAIKKDANVPSTYAESSTGEDFSESLVMYSLSKGTKCEATAKLLYPERYKALDKLMK